MDYKDYQAGFKVNGFWLFGKTEFIGLLLKQLNLPKDINILNVGAGTGNDIHQIKKNGNVFVLDIDQKALDLIPDNLVKEKKVANACEIPYPENSFDLVVSFDVLEHIEDDHKAVSEIKRVLKPGGFFVFTVPAYSFLFSAHDEYLDHYRRYNKLQLIDLLKEFKKIELGSRFFFLFIPIALDRLINRLINKNREYKLVKFPKIINVIGCWILSFENYLFKKGLRYPWGSSFYGIYKKD